MVRTSTIVAIFSLFLIILFLSGCGSGEAKAECPYCFTEQFQTCSQCYDWIEKATVQGGSPFCGLEPPIYIKGQTLGLIGAAQTGDICAELNTEFHIMSDYQIRNSNNAYVNGSGTAQGGSGNVIQINNCYAAPGGDESVACVFESAKCDVCYQNLMTFITDTVEMTVEVAQILGFMGGTQGSLTHTEVPEDAPRNAKVAAKQFRAAVPDDCQPPIDDVILCTARSGNGEERVLTVPVTTAQNIPSFSSLLG